VTEDDTVRVLVSDAIADSGLSLLRESFPVDVRTGLDEDELVSIIGDYDALIVRSGTKVTARVVEAGEQLQVIGRAGVGVDNIDVNAATERGVLVVNAPDGNTVAAAEHTIALLMSLARNVAQADASLRHRKWERKQLMGIEVAGKTLGVVGLGRIGREVSRRGRGLGMRVLAHDPYTSSAVASNVGAELRDRLEDVLTEADFLTVHVPLSAATRGLIGEQELALMKPMARVINVARGGIVDEGALLVALDDGRLAGAALDVFEDEPPFDSPLLQHPKVIVTPHLGASTREAQIAVSVDVAHQVLDILAGKPAAHPLNAPLIPPETQAQLLPFCELARKMGRIAVQLVDTRLCQVRITYAGQLATTNTDPLRALVIQGLLQEVSDRRITLVNANLVARNHGLQLVEEKTGDAGDFSNLVSLSFSDDGRERILSGTVVRDQPHIVRIDQYWLDFVPQGHQLLIYHTDRPGMIGDVGQLTGKADINIAAMAMGRLIQRGEALMLLTLDEYVPPEVQARIEALEDIRAVRMIVS
jgi:D-3-phosphoglycerate dehydrogenase